MSTDPQQTLFELVNHIVNQHPILASHIEQVASIAQGKGWGTATIVHENAMVLKLLKKEPKIAVDIGGNIGDYSAEIRKNNKNTLIHIFEPSAINIQKLSLRFASDNKIKILPFAVSDNFGTATLFSNEAGSGLGSLTQRRLEHFNIHFNVQEPINTIRFEDYWKNEIKCQIIDILKIDIEGHELSALKGFGDAIFSTNIIQFEFGGCNIDTRTFFQDFWYFFKEHNFDLFRISPRGVEGINAYKESDEYFSTTNYIAVNKILN
jgi:FkbM family methyltransferase